MSHTHAQRWRVTWRRELSAGRRGVDDCAVWCFVPVYFSHGTRFVSPDRSEPCR